MGNKRLYHAVADQIRDMIHEGLFPLRSRLPAERDLAEKLGVSRDTIREAEIALEAAGLLDVRVGSGVYVLRQAAEHTPQMPDVSAFELTEARSAIESEGAALATATITEEELDSLDKLVKQMAKGTEGDPDLPLAEDADKKFHLAIARASKNNAIVDSVERLLRIRNEKPTIRKTYDSICGMHPEMQLKKHRDIAAALRKRDSAGARRAMRKHFKCTMEAILSATEAQAIERARRRTRESRERFLNGKLALS